MFCREIFWLVISRFLYFLVAEYRAAKSQARRGPGQADLNLDVERVGMSYNQ